MARSESSKRKKEELSGSRHEGKPSVFTCPDCQGTLFIVDNGSLIRFRCRIGHIYSPEAMLEAQDDNVERLMWSAARALDEQSEYIAQMADQIAGAKDPGTAKEYLAKSRTAMQKGAALRELITADSQRQGPKPVSDLD